MKLRLAICTLLLTVFASGPAVAQQPIRPGDSGMEGLGIKYFEGSLMYTVRVTGSELAEMDQLLGIKNMTMHIRGGDFIIHLYGPEPDKSEDPFAQVFPTTRLYINKDDKMYILDMPNRRYFDNEGQGSAEMPGTAVPTGNKQSIMGYECDEFVLKKRDGEVLTLYIHPDFRANTALFAGKKNARNSFLIPGLNGCIPLKTVRTRPGGYKMETILFKAQQTTLKPENFLLPKNFKREGFDYRRG